MPILTPTDYTACIAYLGIVHDRNVTLCSDPQEVLQLDFEGPVGECHAGHTRPSCSRVKLQYPRGTEIGNARQLSVLSVEELGAVASEMGIERIAPEWTGANIVLEGLPDLTQIPPSSRLIFENGTSIVNDMQNGPCKFVAEEIERHFPGKGLAFPAIARIRRGICGWVERPGTLRAGMVARLHVPPTCTWSGAA
ncbi:MAG: MOSC domain-containing protein [Pseudomonadota bacterium]